jgi:hypothetical protein
MRRPDREELEMAFLAILTLYVALKSFGAI